MFPVSHSWSCGNQEETGHSSITYQIEGLCVSGGWEENQLGGKREEEGVKATKECLMEESKTHKLTMDLGFPRRAVLPTGL